MDKSVHAAVDANVNKEQTCYLANLKDVTFSTLFAINTVIIFALCMTYGVGALSDPQPDKKTIEESGEESADSSHRQDALVWLGGICLITVVASILSIAFVYAISTLTAHSISCTMYTVLAFTGACATFLLLVGNVVGGILALALLIASFVFYYYVKDRISFAAVNMKTAGSAITAMPSTIFYAYGIMVVAILWIFMWTIAVYGVATNEASTHITHNGQQYNIEECTTYTYSGTVTLADTSVTCGSDSCRACVCDDGNGDSTLVKTHGCFSSEFDVGIYIAMLLSVMWAVSVFTHMVHCTTSGAVASWWFNASSTPNSSVVRYSFIRAATTSFGPICLGSLLGAIVGVSRFSIRYLKSTASCSTRNGCCSPRQTSYLLSCLDTALKMLEKAVKYFNRYAYCYVAIYGDSFVDASKSVYKLFRSRGLSAVINDGLIDTVMRFIQAGVGMLCLVFSHWYSYAADLDYASRTALSAIALAQGYFLSAITLKVFSAAVTTIYVCYAEDPQAFQCSHPDLYIPLHAAWQKIYPPSTTEIDDSVAEDDEERLLGGGEKKSGYVPPSLNSISSVTTSGSVGPSWYYTSVPNTGEPDGESDDPKEFKGWASTSSVDVNKKNTKKTAQKDVENAVVAAAIAHPEAAAAVASGIMSVAMENPDMMSAALGLASSQKPSGGSGK